ncbi:MAG: hypothetical protein KDI71_24350 [Xanthomonadales bacterium]|nr:hypothetical protein [Xanthomonadales bacterium]
MPDLLIRGIDAELAERIKEHARTSGTTLNTCVLNLLRTALEGGGTKMVERGMLEIDAEQSEVRMLGGAWSGDEAKAFRDALASMERIDK